MQHIGGVHRFQSAERLVDEVLTVVVGKLLCANDAMHVRLHEFLHSLLVRAYSCPCWVAVTYLNQVDLSEGIVVSRLLDV